jgi:nucleoside-diphosphate-sugar epimerase
VKTAVVTGASSFVGCHLAMGFAQKGWAVAATGTQTFDAYERIQAERLKWIGKTVSWQSLDLRDEKSVRGFIARVRPELWVHHAGHAVNYGSPDYDVRAGHAVNVAPLPYIYDELAKAGCGGVIVTGSSMEYSDTDQACRETDECKPATPYGRSKLEETNKAKELSKLVPTRVARLFIPFGPLDATAKVLMYVVENLKKGLPVELSPCTQRRDFLAVGDVVKAYGLLADDLKRGGFDIFNICSGEAVAVRSLIEMIADRLGASRDLLGFGRRAMRPGEPKVSYGSCDKARKILGWHPGTLDEGIAGFLHRICE